MPGYLTGWEAVFKRPEGFNTAQVNSAASWYGSVEQDRASMRDTDKRTAKDKEITRISVGARLGDEARAYRIPGTSGVVIYAVVWRYRNVKALVLVAGTPSSGATSSAATRLAAKQQRRIKASF